LVAGAACGRGADRLPEVPVDDRETRETIPATWTGRRYHAPDTLLAFLETI